MTDELISRQAAIEALNKMKIYRPLNSDRYVISDCLNKIINLPSAQSEMIKEIRRWINSGNRGNADYFIVDRIEEIINAYE